MFQHCMFHSPTGWSSPLNLTQHHRWWLCSPTRRSSPLNSTAPTSSSPTTLIVIIIHKEQHHQQLEKDRHQWWLCSPTRRSSPLSSTNLIITDHVNCYFCSQRTASSVGKRPPKASSSSTNVGGGCVKKQDGCCHCVRPHQPHQLSFSSSLLLTALGLCSSNI